MYENRRVYDRPAVKDGYPAAKHPDNVENILEVLFDAYNKSSGFVNTAIKADFEELYRLMNGKPLKEIDEIIYAVCTLCRDHEKAGFIEGVKVGMSLVKELNIP